MGLAKRYVDRVEKRRGIPGLIRLLNGFRSVGTEAMDALKKAGPDVIPDLVSTISDSRCSELRRERAASVLASVADQRNVDELIHLADTINETETIKKLQRAIGRIGGEKAYSYLTQALQRKIPDERSTIAEILASTNNSRFILPLTEILERWYDYDNQHDVESALFNQGAAEGLARLGGAEVVPSLIRHAAQINSNPKVIRCHSVTKVVATGRIMEAIAATGSESAELLITTLKHKDPLVRTVAAGALGYIRDHRAVMSLVECLKDKNAAVREYAVRSLGMIGDKSATDRLKDLLNDPSEDVRKQVRSALDKLGQ